MSHLKIIIKHENGQWIHMKTTVNMTHYQYVKSIIINLPYLSEQKNLSNEFIKAETFRKPFSTLIVRIKMSGRRSKILITEDDEMLLLHAKKQWKQVVPITFRNS